MHGLPTQTLSKSSKTEVFGDKKATGKTVAGVNVAVNAEEATESANSGFASLLEGLKGKSKVEKKPSDVKSETGETLKNLISEKNKDGSESKIENTATILNLGKLNEKSNEIKTDETIKNLTSNLTSKDKQTGKLVVHANGKEVQASELDGHVKKEEVVQSQVGGKSHSLNQILNNLHADQEVEVDSDLKMAKDPKALMTEKNSILEKQNTAKVSSEGPLDFLVKNNQPKISNENKVESKSSDLENTLGQKKITTADDYLKNFGSIDKKTPAKLALMDSAAEMPKNNQQNVKSYGQGLALISDPIIKNPKEMITKETKKGNDAKLPKSISDLSEVSTKDTRQTSENSNIKPSLIPDIQNNRSNHDRNNETQTQANQKVLDLGKLDTANTTEIIKRISDYVEQNQVANKASLDLTVKHDSLGEFKIQVSKSPTQSSNPSQNLIDMQITTSSKEGHDFFVKNEVSLMKNLNQGGINLSDLRIVSTMTESNPFGQSDSRQSSSFSQNPDGSEKQFSSFESRNFSSDSNQGSERRKELWEEYQQRYGA